MFSFSFFSGIKTLQKKGKTCRHQTSVKGWASKNKGSTKLSFWISTVPFVFKNGKVLAFRKAYLDDSKKVNVSYVWFKRAPTFSRLHSAAFCSLELNGFFWRLIKNLFNSLKKIIVQRKKKKITSKRSLKLQGRKVTKREYIFVFFSYCRKSSGKAVFEAPLFSLMKTL